MRLIGLVAIAVTLTGCVSMPDRLDANWLHVSHPLGAQLKDSGFYGDGFIFTSRVGIKLWNK